MKLKSIPSCDLTKEFNGKTLYVKTDVVFCVKMKECHLLCICFARLTFVKMQLMVGRY